MCMRGKAYNWVLRLTPYKPLLEVLYKRFCSLEFWFVIEKSAGYNVFKSSIVRSTLVASLLACFIIISSNKLRMNLPLENLLS